MSLGINVTKNKIESDFEKVLREAERGNIDRGRAYNDGEIDLIERYREMNYFDTTRQGDWDRI